LHIVTAGRRKLAKANRKDSMISTRSATKALVTRKAHVGAVEETLTRRASLTGNF
jgi:hypothetical protein